MKLYRKDFMTDTHKTVMGKLKRTHENCMLKTGVARPGKTAHERYLKHGV